MITARLAGRIAAKALFVVALATLSRPVLSQTPPPAPGAAVSVPGELTGRIVDRESGAPVPAVAVRVNELGRGDLARGDGGFVLRDLPPGEYTVVVQRVGYATSEIAVTIRPGETTAVTIELRATALPISGLVVTTSGAARAADEVFQPVSAIEGAELRQRLSTSVAATIAGEPGISERYNGPAASQPVIRGLSGDRVLMLEDGNRSGDVAASAADHAVSIDPASAERIEVVRGPAGLLYGSNALGGVINVIREDVPRTRPERTTGRMSLQGESVNGGMAAAGELRGAAGSVAWRASASGRSAGDTKTPLGALPSTDLSGHSAGAGFAWIRPETIAGLAVRDFALNYGVPGSFQGETIPGAHEGGVTIEMRRVSGTGSASWLGGWGPFSSVGLDATYTWYHHREIESAGIVGTEFGQLSGTARLVARHRHESGGLRREGAVGFWTLARDFSVAGSNTGSRPAREYVGAAFGYEELAWERFRLQLGARYDQSRIEPLDTSPGLLGEIRTRDFGALSGSVAGMVDLVEGVTIGLSASRAFRTPSVEELFSNGPHLADFSYNIGNPSLDPEFGFGLDAFVRYSSPRMRGEIGIFRNSIRDFVHYLPTGQLDPRLNRYPVYQAAQTDAILRGGEAVLEWEALRSLALRSSVSVVRGSRGSDGSPLPEMPPLHWSQSARYERPRWFATIEWRGAAAQERVAENETATDGYSLLDAGAGFRWNALGGFHSITVAASNLTDAVWRDHLSRIRTVAPQPGRNLRILYQIEM